MVPRPPFSIDLPPDVTPQPSTFSPDSLSVEHIIPRSRGGRTILNNLALLCQGCNNHKYTLIEAPDPLTADPAPLYHPRRDVGG